MRKKKIRKIEVVDLEDMNEEDYFTLAYGKDIEDLTQLANEMVKELNLVIVDYQHFSYALVLVYRMSIHCGKK